MFLPILFKVNITTPVCRFNNQEHTMGVYDKKTRRESGAFSGICISNSLLEV
jgi:hypothetical protein